jgi:hypothetical protein
MSTAERPVAKAELVNQEEYNKKFKSWTDNFRTGYKEIGYRMLEAFAQYQPSYTYTDEMGQVQTVEMPTGNIRDQLNLDLAVSSEEWNMTMRRETSLMKYQLLSDYLTKVMGMVQIMVNPMAPSDAKKFVAQANDVGARAMAKILEDFEDTESESMDVDMRKSVDVEKCIQASPDVIQQAIQQTIQGMAQQADQQAMAQEQMGGPQMGGQMGGPPMGGPPPEEMGMA